MYYQSYSVRHVHNHTLYIPIICCFFSLWLLMCMCVVIVSRIEHTASLFLYSSKRMSPESTLWTPHKKIIERKKSDSTTQNRVHSTPTHHHHYNRHSHSHEYTKTRKSIFGTITTHRLWYYPFLWVFAIFLFISLSVSHSFNIRISPNSVILRLFFRLVRIFLETTRITEIFLDRSRCPERCKINQRHTRRYAIDEF